MHWANNLRKLQVDLTSHCNASCLGCHRNIDGGPRAEYLNFNHFSLETWNRLMREDLANTVIEKINFNGNWGDAIMHPDLYDIIKTVVDSHPETFIILSTNGSVRSATWWAGLAQLLGKHPHQVNFALDGLKGKHELYRRNTSFDLIVRNIKAFTDAKGQAQIVTTVFNTNADDYDKLYNLAKELGCVSFNTRKSHHEEYIGTDENSNEYSVNTFNTYHIPRENKDIRKNRAGRRKNRPAALTDTQETICPWYNLGEVQIDPWMNVWPCGHLSPAWLEHPFPHEFSDDYYAWFNDADVKFGEFNNLTNHAIKDILSHDWFNSHLPTALENAPFGACRRNCNIEVSK